MLVYAGIDEAGYGPMLGPLCVGMVALECEARSEVPDIWQLCSHAICRRPKDAGTLRIAIDDSKALKLPNSCKTRDPLTHLERGVLACLASAHPEEAPASDDQLAEAVGIRTSGLDWYEGDPLALPLGTTREHISLLASRTGASLSEQGFAMSMIRCACADERVFNTLLGECGTKASASFCVVARLINCLCDHYADQSDATFKLVIDRQGSRRSYADPLRLALSPRSIAVREQSERASVYDIITTHGQSLRVLFRSKAESEHFPVALGSMTAKLMRELMMRRFNRYWCGRISELKPTAGYVTDARRWLRDAADHISDRERELLVRKA